MSRSESDASAGRSLPVRFLGWLLSLVLGVVFGSLGTVMQQAAISVAGVPVPYGYILAVLALVLLLVGLRLALPSRLSAAFAALGAIGIVGVLALRSPGGSVLIPANLIGYLWTFTPTVLGLVVLAWPMRRAR